MPTLSEKHQSENIQKILEQKSQIVFDELRNRTLWFIKLRWFVPFSIVAGTLLGQRVGFELKSTTYIYFVAFFILLYNGIFFFISRKPIKNGVEENRRRLQSFTWWQVGFDYVSMFLLIHFTGGVASPLVFFFIFHIIFASILMQPCSSYLFAMLVVMGMIAIALSEYLGWIPNYTLSFKDKSIDLAKQPYHFTLELVFFATSVFITAFSTTSIMTIVKKRITLLVDLSSMVNHLNDRLNVLFSMITTIGSVRHLNKVLDSVTTELVEVMKVQGISVKLLSEDGRFLNYVASHGLDDRLIKNHVIDVGKSLLNAQIIQGKPFITGHVTPGESFQFGEDLAASLIESVLFVPLIVENKVIGILGAYCNIPERFSKQEVDFFRLAAGVVAVAIDSAIAYEKVESMNKERSWFMMRVAHNLKAPLSAIISMLAAMRGDYLGLMNDQQKEYLRRIDRRAGSMISMISELLSLAEKKKRRQTKFSFIDLNYIFGRLERTFKEEAKQKNLIFKIESPDSLPGVNGDSEMIEQMLENLISNSIKYTPTGGKVTVEVSVSAGKTIRIQICDNGIGISKEDLPSVFNEFFRANNARKIEELGTGLGLSIVKEIIEQHGGDIHIESEFGLGTLVIVHLPITQS
ncbi:GAF domain-containing sensor histidine kinase [bacterium]|nr:GAF domain-containing sensor histidine kinase [bacterium]